MAVEAKICGLTRPEDAALAAAHGAARLGVIFAGGLRQVSVAKAREIVAAGAGVPVLGVVAGGTADVLLPLCEAAGLRGVQCHGATDAATVRALRAAGLEVWAVRHLADAADLERLGDAEADAADAVLIEPRVAGQPGGTGVRLDVALAQAARDRLAARRLVLAGGLSPEVVAERIALVRPDVVDVSSGIERAPGIKDAARLIGFLEVVRGCAAGD